MVSNKIYENILRLLPQLEYEELSDLLCDIQEEIDKMIIREAEEREDES